MEQVFETPQGVSLDLKIPAGTVLVRVTEGTASTVRIDGPKELDDIVVELSPRSGGGHRLLVDHRGKRSWGPFTDRQGVRVEVAVPSGTDVTCETGSADVAVEGRIARLNCTTGSGDVRFDLVDGDVTLKSGSGAFEGTEVGGRFRAHTASGDVSVEQAGGAVTAKTASGELRLGSARGSVNVRSVSGDVIVGSAAGRSAVIRSVSGDVRVGVPSGRGVYLDLKSVSGEVRSDLEPTGKPAAAPDLELAASTVSGDVAVQHADLR